MIYQVKDIVFAYNDRIVIDIESFNIEEGKIIILSGLNGSGKTTLLKLLNGLIKPDKGIILFNGFPVEKDNYKHIRENTVYVHQNPILFSGTVFKNIAYGLNIRRLSKDTINKTVDEILSLFDLKDYKDRKSSQLSTGEIKRIAIARALAIKPKVLLLDEPTANVDKENLNKINQTLLSINRNSCTTIIMSSHDTNFNTGIADVIVSIDNGRIEKIQHTRP